MSICTTCYNAPTVPKCSEQIVIADTDLAVGTALRLYFRILSTKRIGYVNAYVNSDGEIVTGSLVDDIYVPAPLELPTGTYVELWVNNDPDNFESRIELFTILEETYDCINVKVQSVQGEYTVVDLRPEV